jgi:hypothetical protein
MNYINSNSITRTLPKVESLNLMVKKIKLLCSKKVILTSKIENFSENENKNSQMEIKTQNQNKINSDFSVTVDILFKVACEIYPTRHTIGIY